MFCSPTLWLIKLCDMFNIHPQSTNCTITVLKLFHFIFRCSMTEWLMKRPPQTKFHFLITSSKKIGTFHSGGNNLLRKSRLQSTDHRHVDFTHACRTPTQCCSFHTQHPQNQTNRMKNLKTLWKSQAKHMSSIPTIIIQRLYADKMVFK